MEPTYEELLEQARKASLNGRYGAVVEIVNYRTGRSRVTVASGTGPLSTHTRGCDFRGIMAQWFNGKPYPNDGAHKGQPR